MRLPRARCGRSARRLPSARTKSALRKICQLLVICSPRSAKPLMQHVAERHAVLVRHGDQVVETDEAYVAQALRPRDGRMGGNPGEKALLGQNHHLTRHVGSDVGQIARGQQRRQVEGQQKLEVFLAPRIGDDPRRAGPGQSCIRSGARVANQRIQHPCSGKSVPTPTLAPQEILLAVQAHAVARQAIVSTQPLRRKDLPRARGPWPCTCKGGSPRAASLSSRVAGAACLTAGRR